MKTAKSLFWVTLVLLFTILVQMHAQAQDQDVVIGSHRQAVQSYSVATAFCEFLKRGPTRGLGKCTPKLFANLGEALDSLNTGKADFVFVMPEERRRAFTSGMKNLRTVAIGRLCQLCPVGTCTDTNCNCNEANCTENRILETDSGASSNDANCEPCTEKGMCGDGNCGCIECSKLKADSEMLQLEQTPKFVLVTVSKVSIDLVYRTMAFITRANPPDDALVWGQEPGNYGVTPLHRGTKKYLEGVDF